MFEINEIVYYIDLIDGKVKKAKFIDEEKDGSWIKIDGEPMNTYVYADLIEERLFVSKEKADLNLERLKEKSKAALLEDNKFIDDITKKLSKSEGAFYAGIIREILQEKVLG